MTFEMLVIEFDPVDGFITVEDPAVEIEGRQAALVMLGCGRLGSSVFRQSGTVRIRQIFRTPFLQGLEGIRIGNSRFLFSPHRNRLQHFGTHHRSHARPAVGPVAHADQCGITDHFFPGRPDLQNFNPLVFQFIPDLLLCFPGDLAPKMGRIA